MKKKGPIKREVTKKDLRCKICNKSGFNSKYKLNSHLFLHKAVPARHKCSFCPKEYYRSDEYSRHLASHMRTQKQYCCDHCGRGFVDKRNLVMHLNIHDDEPRRPDCRYKCVACDAHYCEERLLKYHIRKAHLNLNTSEPIHITKKLNETWIEAVKDTKSYVEITKVKPNTLVIKKSKISSLKDLKGADEVSMVQQYIASVFAMKDNNYSKATCDYCGKEMLKKSIVTHIRERHLKLRRFHCNVCSRTFKRHYQLCLHNCGQGRKRKVTVESRVGKKIKLEKSMADKKVKVERSTVGNKIKDVKSAVDGQKNKG